MFSETLLSIPFSVIGLRSAVSAPRWLQGKCPNLGVTGDLPYLLRDHRRFRVKIAALRSLKKFTESIFKISNKLGAR